MRADARAMSLKARVRNRAAALGLAPHVVLQNYMFERFLVRLAASPWRERLVLKGGLLVAHLHGLAERATMDMDATVRGFALTADSAVAAVADVCAVDAGDGIAFSVASGEPIRRNDPYGGFRVHFDAVGLRNASPRLLRPVAALRRCDPREHPPRRASRDLPPPRHGSAPRGRPRAARRH